jgi:hypothetical protein
MVMWGRKRQAAAPAGSTDAPAGSLKASVRKVRLELAERSSVVVDLRDAELARLELLNEALDPLFDEIPAEIELFDRAITKGDTPRLWIDVIAYVAMGRDKRRYTFIQDTRFGRKILADSAEIKDIVDAITHYVASRLIERERALADDLGPLSDKLMRDVRVEWRRRRWRLIRAFLFGLVLGCVSLFAALWIVASRVAH